MLLLINNNLANDDLGEMEMREKLGGICEKHNEPYTIMHCSEVDGTTLEKHPEITGVIVGGSRDNWDNIYFPDHYSGEYELMRTVKVPFLGVCAGHMLLAMAYGGAGRKMFFGREERGFHDVSVIQDSILNQGIGDTLSVWFFHSYDVAEIPDGFDNLMQTRNCPIQAMKKRGEHIYSVMFHPEGSNEEHPHGFTLMKNFIDLTREEAKK